MKREKLAASATIGSLLTGTLLLLFQATGCHRSTLTEENRKPVQAVPVSLVQVTQAEIERTSIQPATIHAFYETDIHSRVSGYVSDLQADIGDVVTSGQLLLTIAVPELRKQQEVLGARIARLEAAEEQSQAGVLLAEARVEAARARTAEVQSQLASTEAVLAAADAELSRTRDLVQRGSLQNRILDEATKKRDSAQAAKQAMSSSVVASQSEVTVADAELQSARAALTAARADTKVAQFELEEIEVMIDYATITAPFDGVVTQRHVSPGDLVSQDNANDRKPLMVVSQVNKLRVQVPVPESDAAHIDAGDELLMTLPSFSGESPVQAIVTRSSGSLDPSTRTMLVEAELPNPDGKYLPGMFGEATISLSTKIAANVLPSRAVRATETGEAYVYVISDDNAVKVTSVTTGADDGKVMQLLSGIEAGDRVIDAHLKRFVDGQKVAILEP